MSRLWSIGLALLAAAGGLFAEPSSTPADEVYGRAYEVERSEGNPDKALRLYEGLLAGGALDAALQARVLHRVAVCRKRTGRVQAAAEAWQELIARCPDEREMVTLAKAELDLLRAGLDWIAIRGRVVDASGAPVTGAYVMAGAWLTDPWAVTGADGGFSLRRKAAHSDESDLRYCLVYAEHPDLPLAALAVVRPGTNNAAGITLALGRTAPIGGRVTRKGGQPIGGARLKVGASADDAPGIRIPYDLLTGTVRTVPDGRYRIDRMVVGLQYTLTAEIEGYRPASLKARPSPDAAIAPDLILDPAGQGTVAGHVSDDDGSPLIVRVTALTMPPEGRELASAVTGIDGRYRIAYLPDGPLVVRVESTEGYAPRALTGIPSKMEDADLVLTRKRFEDAAAAPGQAAPAIRGTPANASAVMLAHLSGRVVLIYFWDRRDLREPLRYLKAMQSQYGRQRVAVICMHDHSGYLPELVRVAQEETIDFPIVIDEYGATARGGVSDRTLAAYGAEPGQLVIVDRRGRLDSRFPLKSGQRDGALGQRVTALLAEQQTRVAPGGGETPGAAAGQPAPELVVSRWIRGEALNGGPVSLGDLAGRFVVLHFSSAYVMASLRASSPDEVSSLERMSRQFAPRGVSLVWMLPSADRTREAENLAVTAVDGMPIGIDREGKTFMAYGVNSVSFNCVVDREGRVCTVGCSDNELFSILKSHLAASAAGVR